VDQAAVYVRMVNTRLACGCASDPLTPHRHNGPQFTSFGSRDICKGHGIILAVFVGKRAMRGRVLPSRIGMDPLMESGAGSKNCISNDIWAEGGADLGLPIALASPWEYRTHALCRFEFCLTALTTVLF